MPTRGSVVGDTLRDAPATELPSASTGRWRVRVYVLLVACYLIQTGFVYFDYPRDGMGVRLSPSAREGLMLWRRNNCQACHQIYGFGGFLGPDLTNLMSHRPNEDWTSILTDGRKQMPAFHFDEPERGSIVAFLQEIDRTGTGFPQYAQVDPGLQLDFMVEAYANGHGGAVGETVLRGEQTVRTYACRECHVPFGVGNEGAPDLTLAMSTRPVQYLRTVLENGKGTMPEYVALTDKQLDDIIAYLGWLGRNRERLGRFHTSDGGGNSALADLPWFEY